jgi:SAM-dependent methyltransferase
MTISDRKKAIINQYNNLANSRLAWKEKNRYFHEQDLKYLSFLIPKGSTILDIGCGVGDTLEMLKPIKGVGIDISENMIEKAKNLYPDYTFITGDIEDKDFLDSISDTFDFILLSDTIGSLEDCQATLNSLHKFCTTNTRIIISYYSYLWSPLLKLTELLKFKMPQPEMNFLPTDDIHNLLNLSGHELIKQEWRQLIPLKLFGIGDIINRFIAALPFIRKLCVRNYLIARSKQAGFTPPQSCTVVIPCRNEKGNIEAAVNRIPEFCKDIEIIFIEGHSKDNTYEEIQRVISEYPQLDIKAFQQDGVGKADAVYKAFDNARGDVLMILDADLTMPPEELYKFWDAISSGQGEYINGSRLVYPMDKDAMRFLNLIANHTFSIIFSWLLNQRYTDTLCGTKVMLRSDYVKIKNNQSYFGDFDPFGDFDLIFGSSKLNLKMVEIPIRYKARSYGSTQISRFRHGLQLLRMVIHGFRKLKAF